MAEQDDPDRDDEPDPAAPNPFAGTPMEALFGALGTPGGQTPDLAALFGQMQRLFQPHEGPIDFVMAKDVARHAVASAGPDPSPTSAQGGAVDDAVRLAETWLDQVTDVPAAATSAAAWSRAEWIEATAPTWQTLVLPIAEHVVAAMGEAVPEEAKAMAEPLIDILSQAGGAMFGQQIGQALAGLAGEVVSSTDIGLPLGPERTAAVLPANVAAFGEGLEHTEADVLLYVVLRECAHHRLFHHAPWLRGALVGAIEEFGRGTRIDLSAIESTMQGIDPSRPEELAEAMQGGLFEPERTPEQQHAIQRLELLLALVEGWVDEVVDQATRDTMPAAASLAEAVRRRRAAGGPAEQTFASLVGLELRPRRMRDAASLWAAVRDRRGPEARDAVWKHPDLMPTAADLDDPLGFAQGEAGSMSDEEFDAAIGELLDRGDE
jgi:putative hydrolase